MWHKTDTKYCRLTTAPIEGHAQKSAQSSEADAAISHWIYRKQKQFNTDTRKHLNISKYQSLDNATNGELTTGV